MNNPFGLLFTMICFTILLVSACSLSGAQQANSLGDLEAEGERVFNQQCTSCHTKDADTVTVGPALGKIGAQAGLRVQDQDAHQYLEISILHPGEYMVEGYPNVMPLDFGKKLSNQELDALLAYLISLK